MRTNAERHAARRAWQSTLPEGRVGRFEIQRFTIDDGLQRMAYMLGGRDPGEPGTYTRLVRRYGDAGGGTTVMSDTRAEYRDHAVFIGLATGRVLIHGLGLGCSLSAILTYADVEHVDVVELEADVLALVAPHFTDPRVRFHHGDALTYRFPPGTRWNVAWHDIWDAICADNLPDMRRLHRRYGGRVDWQGSWARALAERVA